MALPSFILIKMTDLNVDTIENILNYMIQVKSNDVMTITVSLCSLLSSSFVSSAISCLPEIGHMVLRHQTFI